MSQNAHFILLVSLLTTVFFSHSIYATSYVWARDTHNYRVYMSVVPADIVQNQPRLLDKDKRLHNVIPGSEEGISHVLVWVYKKVGNERLLDVTIIAEAGPVFGGKIVKPLEKMKLGTGVTYGNFFKLHQDSDHTIRLKIYQINSEGHEEVTFNHIGY